MEYRVEKKYLVTDADLMLLEQRLKTVMNKDIHQMGDRYEIRSLYFDDVWETGMNENEAGVDHRTKYRIRTYGVESEVIHMEIKEKLRGMTKKTACDLSKEECIQIMKGDICMRFDERKPLNQLYVQMRCNNLIPKTIILYERSAYVHPVGNVRITFDRNIMASSCCNDFFDEEISNLVSILPKGIHVLEVKYDELMPDYIAEQLEIGILHQTAFSKYYLGRLAIRGEFVY